MPEKTEGERLSRKEIIEKFQEKRLELARKIADKINKNPDAARFVSALFNATAGYYIKVGAEIIYGKTADGQKLTPLGRIIDVFMVGTGLAGWAMTLSGHIGWGSLTSGSAWVAYGFMYSSDLVAPVVKVFADTLEPKNPKFSHILRIVANNCETYKKLFFEVKDAGN